MRRHAPLVRFNRIGRENNRINNRNNGPSPENNRGGWVREQINLEVPKRWVTTDVDYEPLCCFTNVGSMRVISVLFSVSRATICLNWPTIILSNLQDPLILERRGIRIGFLGYCDSLSVNKNCTEMRMLFNSGPAVYRDDIATRDVNKLKQVSLQF